MSTAMQHQQLLEELATDAEKYLRDLEKQTDEDRILGLPMLSVRLQSTLAATYNAGGFEAVDFLTANINDCLKSRGSKTGFGRGGAAEGPVGEEPEFLHVYFVDFISNGVVARDAVPLRRRILSIGPEPF